MKLYFDGDSGRLRLLCELEETLPKNELAHAIVEEIRGFCADHGYRIPYTRMWNSQREGREVTVFDVGSHTEFFLTDPPSMDCFLASPGDEQDDDLRFKEWVGSVLSREEETRPFCPFSGPQGIGYCDLAYTDRCYTCEEAIGAFRLKEGA